MGSGVNRGYSECKNRRIQFNQSKQKEENKQKIVIIIKPWGPVGW